MNRREFRRLLGSAVVSATVGSSLWARAAAAVPCAGGATPWDSWLSCDEVVNGLVYECDPF